MIKSLLISAFSAFGKFIPSQKPISGHEDEGQQDYADPAVAAAQKAAELRNKEIRRLEKIAMIDKWIEKENIKARYEENLEWIKKTAVEHPPLPDPLPQDLVKECHGQSESFIRRYLDYKGWRYNQDIKEWSKRET